MTTPADDDEARQLAAKQAELRQRVAAGEWLRTGDVAVLLGVSRSTAHRMVTTRKIAYRRKPGGKQRFLDPADVRKLLDEANIVWRGDSPASP